MALGSALASLAGSVISTGASLYAGHKNRQAQEKANNQNIAMQNDFAHHGIGWKVQDARNARIDPLVALGSPTNMPTANIQSANYGDIADAGKSFAGGVRHAGQSLDKSLSKQLTPEQKQVQALEISTRKAELDGITLDNQYKASRNARTDEPTSLNNRNRMNGFGSFDPDAGTSKAHAIPANVYVKNRNGTYSVVPNPFIGDSYDNMYGGKLSFLIGNQISHMVEKYKIHPADQNKLTMKHGNSIASMLVKGMMRKLVSKYKNRKR